MCIEGIRKGARGAAQNVLGGWHVDFRVRVGVSSKGDAVLLIGRNYKGLFRLAKGRVFCPSVLIGNEFLGAGDV